MPSQKPEKCPKSAKYIENSDCILLFPAQINDSGSTSDDLGTSSENSNDSELSDDSYLPKSVLRTPANPNKRMVITMVPLSSPLTTKAAPSCGDTVSIYIKILPDFKPKIN